MPKTQRPNQPRSLASRSSRRSRQASAGAVSFISRLCCLIALIMAVAGRLALAQTAASLSAAPRPVNPVVQGVGGSCGTQFLPCPSIARLGMFFWFSGQYLGTGLGGDPHVSTFGGSADLAMEVGNRVAVSISVPGALTRTQGQSGEQLGGIGGPLETRVRVRLGPQSPAFYSIQARPRWSTVVEARAQLLIPEFAGDPKYVGRLQRGYLQPSIYGAGELNLWRFQLAPGLGIVVGDRQAHMDLGLRVSIQLLDRLYGDVEVLRRQALSVPAEPGRCQSAWMGAAGARFQFGRGVFMNARYVGGRGDCVPENSFQLNLGLAFGEGFMRIPTPEEVGFIKKWHALLLGMIDPVLDCQGIMRADDGTPMFRFGYPEPRDPSIIRRNNVAYHVGQHFWQKDNNLYTDTDLSSPVLDLHGESPLTFAERAAMHDCPTLPGLGSPCQVALNLPTLRNNVEQSDSPMQLILNEDAQILACLNHLSPVKAAAVFAGLESALGPLLGKLPKVWQWGHPGAPASPPVPPAKPTAVAGVLPQGPQPPAGGAPKVATPLHPSAPRHGQHQRPQHKPRGDKKPAAPDDPTPGHPHFPSVPGWPSGESSTEVADNKPPAARSEQSTKPHPGPTKTEHGPRPAGNTPSPAMVAQNDQPVGSAPKTPPPKQQQKSRPAAATSASHQPVATAPAVSGERGSQLAEPAAPLCGTKCLLGVTTLVMAAGGAAGGELAKDVVIVAAAEGSANMTTMAVAGAAGGAVAGTVVVDGVADHAIPPNAPAEPPRLGTAEHPGTSAGNTANGGTTEPVGQPAPKRGIFKGDLTQLQKEATAGQIGSQGELEAIERLLQEGKNVEKLPERPGQTNPDLLVDGELREIKTRQDPLDDVWVKKMIGKANKQIKTSQFGDTPQGSVDLQLKGQLDSNGTLVQKAQSQVLEQFRVDQSRSLTAVRIYHDGRLLAEWARMGDKIVQVFSVIP